MGSFPALFSLQLFSVMLVRLTATIIPELISGSRENRSDSDSLASYVRFSFLVVCTFLACLFALYREITYDEENGTK